MSMPDAVTAELFDDFHLRYGELILHMNEVLLPKLIVVLNERSKVHFGKSLTELLPKNERNLSDVRTRVGILLEYALAQALDDILEKSGSSYRIGFLVANQFPDLTTRHVETYHQGARIEVKAIQSIAEEKAANFGTLVRDILPEQDLLVVLLWEWERDISRGITVEFPRVLEAVALDPRVIARVRDFSWLSQTGKYTEPKLVDIAGVIVPVEGEAGMYKKEEKNLGKLTRLVDEGHSRDFLNKFNEARLYSIKLYFDFVGSSYMNGAREVIRLVAEELSKKITISAKYKLEEKFVEEGFSHFSTIILKDREIKVFMKGTDGKPTKSDLSYLGLHDEDIALFLNRKFNWNIYQVKAKQVSRKPAKTSQSESVDKKLYIGAAKFSGKKPIHIVEALIQIYSELSADPAPSSVSSIGPI